MSPLTLQSSNKAFGGTLTKYSYKSDALAGLETSFNIYLPPAALDGHKVPSIYYLAGLTCTEDTGPQKSNLLSPASTHNLALVFPDTSPRGAGIEGEETDWDFGTGAGFYLDADKGGYKGVYRMETFVTRELRRVVEKEFNVDPERTSIMGHSMGGHGALSLYLKNPGSYRSASGLAPICNPTSCAWGQKAFHGYLTDPTQGRSNDTTLLLPHFPRDIPLALKLDYGTADKFYNEGQLLPENFQRALGELKRDGDGVEGEVVEVGRREGYDHSYFFVSTFAQEHVEFHAKHLKA